MASRARNSDISAKKTTYSSPLDRLTEKAKKAEKPNKTRSTSVSKVLITSKPKESESVFPTKLIPLENGIDDNRYDDLPQLSLPSPPLPRVSPPPRIVPPTPATAPTAQAAQGKSDLSMQDLLLKGFKSLSDDLGNSFANTMGRLNNSLLKSMDGLRDQMNYVGSTEDPEECVEYEDEDRGLEEGEVQEEDRPQENEVLQVDSLNQLTATLTKDDGLGPDVDAKLGANIQLLMRGKPEEKAIGELFAGIKRPANCSALTQVVVNPAIWEKMPQDGRNQDAKLQRVQLALTKGATELTKFYDTVLSLARNGVEEAASALEFGNNALVCLGIANVDLVQRRREMIKPHFDSDYAHIFHNSTPFTANLFGDELAKQIKEISDDNKLISNVVRKQQTSQRGKPYARGQPAAAQSNYRGGSRGNYQSSYPRARGGRSRQNFGQDRPQPYRRPYPSRDVRHNVRRGTGGRRS